ncbi:hypothetical protein GCM10022223_53190 [Kineosporia mesophila]|uniref:Uncharacterized protein n=2 Tax=Kineosporia mesophila TaxID=566012 RepID=A0ABP7AC56_9ACTN
MLVDARKAGVMAVARFASRFVDGALDVAHQRAPVVTERAYRTVAGPLLLADPAGAAQAVEARLDGTRERVAQMAVRGAVPSAAARRVRRDLARSRADVECIASRLPVVQARSLTLRSSAYSDTLQSLSARPPARAGTDLAWGAGVLGVSLAAWIGGLLLVGGGVLTASLVGVLAGVVTASFVTGARTRRVGRARISAIAESLARADLAAMGSSSAQAPGLDRDRRAQLERARASGRLDQRGLAALEAIDTHLDDLLVRLLEGELEADGIHLVQGTIERYLPDTLEPFLAMPDRQARVRERPAVIEVADQLTSIEAALAELVRRPSRNNLEQQLLRQGEFLRSKFGTPQNAS